MHGISLEFIDLDSGIPVRVYLRYAPGSVLFAFVPEHSGDIEVALDVEDCKTIVALLEEASKSEANYLPAPDRARFPLAHRFKNLDGGEEAAFVISRKDSSLEITVERSDEGEVGFTISVEDAKSLIDAMTSTLMLASASAPQ